MWWAGQASVPVYSGAGASTCSLNRNLVRRNLGILGGGNPLGPGWHRTRPGCAKSPVRWLLPGIIKVLFLSAAFR